MYCPVCFQNTLKICSSGVVKLSFNGKSRNTSIYTYNLQKETQEQLNAKLREKIVDFFTFYSGLVHKDPIKNFEAYSTDFACTNKCKIDKMNTKVTVVGVIYPIMTVQLILQEEAGHFGLEIKISKE